MALVRCQCLVNYSYTGTNQCTFCIENSQDLEWKWDENVKCPGIHVVGQGSNVTFHMGHSSGTAAVRGDMPMVQNYHYFWEIRMFTRLYGTDVMVGVATPNFQLDKSASKFSSLLGSDKKSWGFSYTGRLQHAGETILYSSGFESGDVIGVHLDMWNGTLAFYKNGNPLGIAFRGLRQHRVLYPVVCSTAAKISMGLITAVSVPASLFTLSCRAMAKYPQLAERIMSVPGLKNMCLHKWLFQLSKNAGCEDDDEDMMYVYKGPVLFRTVPGLSSNVSHKFTYQEDLPRFSGLMDQAVTRKGAWGEFTDECSSSSQHGLSDSKDVYSDLSSRDEELNAMNSDDIFEHKQETIKFTNRFNSPLCEFCRLKPAILVKSCTRRCLQCFLVSGKKS